MADNVSSTVIADGLRNYKIKLTNISDGTGESAVSKIDISTLTGPDGSNAPSYFAVKSIEYDVQGFSSVVVYFDATSDDEMAILSGQGFFDYDGAFLNDPQSTGTTGDIKLTTNGAVNGATYDITLNLIKKQ
jgi:hypothetical protein